jgi:hypothetical protein
VLERHSTGMHHIVAIIWFVNTNMIAGCRDDKKEVLRKFRTAIRRTILRIVSRSILLKGTSGTALLLLRQDSVRHADLFCKKTQFLTFRIQRGH